MSENPTEKIIFKAKTKEAFVIKVLGEVLANTLRYSHFIINNRGISLVQPDEKLTQLIEISLNKENFMLYKCSRDINFSINSSNFYKLLKNIKKKDSITISISEINDDSDAMSLGICVEQPDNNNKLTTNIRIQTYQPQVFETPTGYDIPVIISGKEFQSTKNLHHTSDKMYVYSKGQFIRFAVYDDDRHDRKLEVGNENDEENRDCPSYLKTFNTSYITSLCKCAGQSGNIQVFMNEDLPLKIKMKAGNLGDISVYIKNHEMIKDEEDETYLEEKNTMTSLSHVDNNLIQETIVKIQSRDVQEVNRDIQCRAPVTQTLQKSQDKNNQDNEDKEPPKSKRGRQKKVVQ